MAEYRLQITDSRMKKITQILRQNQGTSLIQILLVMVVMITVLIMSGIFNPPHSPVTDKREGIVSTKPSVKKSSLLLIDLPINFSHETPPPEPTEVPLDTPSITPTPTTDLNSCPVSSSVPLTNTSCTCKNTIIECEKGRCVRVITSEDVGITTCDDIARKMNLNHCSMSNFMNKKDGVYCFVLGKPVIYLYPEKPTHVNVGIKTIGKITISDPQIENTNGWTNVLARPNGTLMYKNKQYRELFYETESTTLKRPEKGIVMNKKSLRSDLLKFITQLGLTRQDEQDEFLDWWLPRLAQIKTDKIFVSILEKDEKNRLDKIAIEPKPDTMIEFIAYFAPLADNETVSQLVLPAQPKRIGFTAVEWGGVIGR